MNNADILEALNSAECKVIIFPFLTAFIVALSKVATEIGIKGQEAIQRLKPLDLFAWGPDLILGCVLTLISEAPTSKEHSLILMIIALLFSNVAWITAIITGLLGSDENGNLTQRGCLFQDLVGLFSICITYAALRNWK